MLPPVWAPRAIGTWKSATAAAEPQEEPPGVRFGSCGLVVLGPELVTQNSVVVVLPAMLDCIKKRVMLCPTEDESASSSENANNGRVEL